MIQCVVLNANLESNEPRNNVEKLTLIEECKVCVYFDNTRSIR